VKPNFTSKLDPKLYFKKRIGAVILMMLPSFLIDLILLGRIITRHPVILNQNGTYDFKEIMTLFLANALFLKSEALCFYFELKSFRKKGEVRVSAQKVVYRKKRICGYANGFQEGLYGEYYITNPKEVKIKRTGTVVVKGDFEVIYFLIDGKEIYKKGKCKRISVPPYYENMEQIIQRIRLLNRQSFHTL